MQTHTTIVQRMVQIRRERLLPVSGEVIAVEGQEVSPVQVVARTPREDDFQIIPASDQLRLDPESLTDYLQVEPGEGIEAGTVLLQKRSFPRAKKLISPIQGTFLGVRNGRVILRHTPEWLELRAMLRGRVIRIVGNRGVEIEVSGSLIQAAWGSSKTAYGPIKLVAHTSNAPLTNDMFSSDTSGQVLIVGHLNDPETLRQAEANEVRGLIAGSITADLAEAVDKVSYPILVTDGMGQQRMAAPIFQLFLQSEGKEVTLFGHPDSNRRPEAIIPQEGAAAGAKRVANLAVGQTVRLLREPHHNEVGEVMRVYERARTTTFLSQTYGADVRLPDGSITFVPYANLDALI